MSKQKDGRAFAGVFRHFSKKSYDLLCRSSKKFVLFSSFSFAVWNLFASVFGYHRPASLCRSFFLCLCVYVLPRFFPSCSSTIERGVILSMMSCDVDL